MSMYEIAMIRIKCVEVFVPICSKLDFHNDEAFKRGQKLFDIVMQDIKASSEDKVEPKRLGRPPMNK